METKKIMLLGTGSDVGKTMLTAAVLRLLKRRGLKAAPFKAQNMSNSALVMPDGRALSRAQAMQAEAASAPLTPLMNPILLKPSSATGSDVFVEGRFWGHMTATEYYRHKKQLKKVVLAALAQLSSSYDAVVIEGAGSCSEINLKEFDLVNLGLAKAANIPFALVADIDRGGVFAQAVGAKTLMTAKEKSLFQGLIINKFRGDAALFAEGRNQLARLTGRPVWGVVPFLEGHQIDPEDSLSIQTRARQVRPLNPAGLNVAVPQALIGGDLADLSAIDFEPDVTLNFISDPKDLTGYDLLLLPPVQDPSQAAKSLIKSGWPKHINNFLAAGGRVWALGSQALITGRTFHDGTKKQTGLGLWPGTISGLPLPAPEPASGTVGGLKCSGYRQWALTGDEQALGYQQGRVHNYFLTGMLTESATRANLLNAIRREKNIKPRPAAKDNGAAARNQQYDLWADHVEANLDVDALITAMG